MAKFTHVRMSNVPGVEILGPVTTEAQSILSKEAVEFLASLHRTFNGTRKMLLKRRQLRQQQLDAGVLLDFLPETKHIREDDTWKAAKPAPGLEDRRVEITGPVDRKMVINALNSNVKTYMADFEDSQCPMWSQLLAGQVNLRDAILRKIDFKAANGKEYKLRTDRKLATLIVRPRGWHLDEKHFLVDSEPIAGAILDFGLYFYHNAHELVKTGTGPYFYLPKMESHLEARLWNDIFCVAQDWIGMSRGTIRGTCLIETIPAAFEMDEFIYELRDHSSGLNCGRWDYIFSFIKKFRNHPEFVLPDRGDVTMTVPFMDAYVQLLIKTCHKRGVHAMGGMAAQIPIKNNPSANSAAMNKVGADKVREVKAGHDGTWVAHPDLAGIAMDVFNEHMLTPNQIFVRREDVTVTAKDLLRTAVPGGKITEKGIKDNIEVGLIYCEAWLRGIGCSPINNLMEDAATAEIARTALHQYARHNVTTAEGIKITGELQLRWLREVTEKLSSKAGKGNKFALAAKYFGEQIAGEESKFQDFLTTMLYDEILELKSGSAKL